MARLSTRPRIPDAMSIYKPTGRKSNLMGANLRAGVTPGGFSTVLGAGKRQPKRRAMSIASVREAANLALEKRGIGRNTPDAIFDIRGSLAKETT